jgi:hypothetical protein
VKELWRLLKIAGTITLAAAFLLALALDRGDISGAAPGESTRPFMAFCLALLAIAVAGAFWRARPASASWRVSTGVASVFLVVRVAMLYPELAYLRGGWTWAQVYPDARDELAWTGVSLGLLAICCVGLRNSRRRHRAAVPRLPAETSLSLPPR